MNETLFSIAAALFRSNPNSRRIVVVAGIVFLGLVNRSSAVPASAEGAPPLNFFDRTVFCA
ncbi:MAG: hypothetical protein P4L99_23585 [Chthoniobacter sp.]|nr:hypothetical protein [Chthoniobacter sp.]